MLAGEHGRDRTLDDDLAVGEHCDAVANGVEAVEIVGDHQHREAERLLQCLDQRIEFARCDGIQPRCRLVEEDDLRIERERARQGRALGHSAGKLRGKFFGVFGAEAHHAELW